MVRITRLLLSSFLFSLILPAVVATKYSVYYKKGIWKVVESNGMDTDTVASITYETEQMQTGWDRLYITTNATKEDRIQAHGAGYGEGYLTPQPIWDTWVNFVNSTFPKSIISAPVQKYFEDNYAWMNQMIINRPHDLYWQNVALVLAQMKGLTQGYNDAAAAKNLPQLSIIQQIMVNSDGDLEDILGGIIPNTLHMRKDTASKGITNTHCSALIRPTNDWSELYAGHTTWSSYVDMLRTYKVYDFRFKNPGVVSTKTSFSSYPSCVSSIDDFYILSSNLSVIETTNGNFNQSLYAECSYRSLWSWIRVVVANRMATDGESWTNIFAKYNSGTYNNQWIITDYNKFTKGQKSSKDLVWILEQIPGKCQSADVTGFVLKNGHWPSFNVPYFPDIFAISGFGSQNTSWLTAPRANIFRRDANKVETDQDMQNMMRYNNWQHDPFSLGDPMNSISSRGDLEDDDEDRAVFGGIDSKYTSAKMMTGFTAMGISGPTYVQQPIFSWIPKSWMTAFLHVGCPGTYSFPWQSFHY